MKEDSTMTDAEVSFLQGLVAGEGCFTVKLQKSSHSKFGVMVQPRFSMGMVEDSDILNLLCEKTGLGSVYEKNDRRENCSDSEEWQIHNKKEIERLKQFLDRPTEDGREFLLGLIAAEGCFKIALRRCSSCKFGVEVRPSFSMKMAEDSDILNLLCEKTGLGSVYEKEAKRENWSDKEEWQIWGKKEREKLMDMVEERPDSLFWKTDKGRTFEKWKRAVRVKEKRGTSDPAAVKELIRISKSLNDTNRGKSKEEWFEIVESNT